MMSPMSALINSIRDNLKKSDIPVKSRLPDAKVPEPFIVIGSHFDDDAPSGKNGFEVLTTDLQIDLFYSIDSRTALEETIFSVKSQIKQATSRITRVTSNTITDDSVGRDVYHVTFIVTAII
ncbi:hypothetical protein [Leuconostoc gasicomitatum]|uniref:hypothetical protein n=1 Tax=Leuconostoc gasicomitatum TaxID=115778 RepID=UPI0015CD7622|nr:hypothetical protein [Leuconostoc gasicomitatum]QLG77575.1 hypothetical protein LeuG3613_01355 [Leuconostoc gasicomitatum]